ncbi:acyl-coenzyme A thioesterase 13-like [Athalia rosae]|uniref:acyl-coenzyme A thioesterase 13-like n=1 Tax=Athalia rosae TaxID=37344 RepID=UPI0020334CAA|nr:acyl-coenzyme A thioesterase 13-like [Athalia rosae]
MSRGVAIIKQVMDSLASAKGFSRCMKNVTVVSAGDGKCRVEFPVEEGHLNGFGTLHGGFTATIVDNVSTYALMTAGNGAPGVSVDLHVSYLKAANPGEVIVVDAKTCKAGKTLAFLEVELTKKETGELVARGQHTKFVK